MSQTSLAVAALPPAVLTFAQVVSVDPATTFAATTALGPIARTFGEQILASYVAADAAIPIALASLCQPVAIRQLRTMNGH